MKQNLDILPERVVKLLVVKLAEVLRAGEQKPPAGMLVKITGKSLGHRGNPPHSSHQGPASLWAAADWLAGCCRSAAEACWVTEHHLVPTCWWHCREKGEEGILSTLKDSSPPASFCHPPWQRLALCQWAKKCLEGPALVSQGRAMKGECGPEKQYIDNWHNHSIF